MEEQEIKSHLEEFCSNCHFTWQPGKDTVNLDIERLENKLLTDIQYDSEDIIPAYTLMVYLFVSNNQLDKAKEYAEKACKADKRNNGHRYVTLAVSLHTSYICRKWDEMAEKFKEIQALTLTPQDNCYIQLTKGYAHKKAEDPSFDKTIEAYRLAREYDEENPEGFFQEALALNRKRRQLREQKSHLKEKELIEKAMLLWKDDKHYTTYPQMVLAEIELDRIIMENGIVTHRPIKNEGTDDSQRERNYKKLKKVYEDVLSNYDDLDKNYKYSNKTHDMCIMILGNILQVLLPKKVYQEMKQMIQKVILKAIELYPDDPTIAYHAGRHFYHMKDTSKAVKFLTIAEKCPTENKWATLLLAFTKKEPTHQKNAIEAVINKFYLTKNVHNCILKQASN